MKVPPSWMGWRGGTCDVLLDLQVESIFLLWSWGRSGGADQVRLKHRQPTHPGG